MANTRIQLKRSSVTPTPAGGSLNAAEPAYSYSSNTLFIGGSDGVGVLPVGGYFYVTQQAAIWNAANAAFTAANNAGTTNYANAIGAASNSWANTVGTAGNNYTNSVGTAGNNYTNFVGASGNNWANTVGTAGNNYTNSVGTAGNNYTNSVGTAGNNYTNAVGAASNNYASLTYVKLTAPSQTITGDLAITGNLTFTGNTTFLDSQSLVVGDSLIYLAANNYSGTDILDIGFVANYGNATAQNVHTGLIRDATTKQYYLFNGLDIELQGNNSAFVPYANNAVNAALNADLITSNLTLGGANAILTFVNNAAGANGWANVINSAIQTSFPAVNNYTNSVGTAGNNYTNFVGASGNNWANTINSALFTSFAAGNNYTNSVGTAGNNYMISVATAGNNYSNTLNTKIFQTFSDAANLISGTLPSARLSGSYTGITGVGTITVGTWHGDTINVAYGGTGVTSFTNNGVLYGAGGSGALQVTAAGTDGQVLQSNQGVPQFAMLDGGTF